jgi:hypothetical protein
MSATVQTRLTGRRTIDATRLGDRPMSQTNQSSSYRTDEQLQSILHDTANWVIHGRGGFSLGHTASLHEAFEKVTEFAQTGATILAITRLPNDNIIIFEEQVDRLHKIVAGRKSLRSQRRTGVP